MWWGGGGPVCCGKIWETGNWAGGKGRRGSDPTLVGVGVVDVRAVEAWVSVEKEVEKSVEEPLVAGRNAVHGPVKLSAHAWGRLGRRQGAGQSLHEGLVGGPLRHHFLQLGRQIFKQEAEVIAVSLLLEVVRHRRWL